MPIKTEITKPTKKGLLQTFYIQTTSSTLAILNKYNHVIKARIFIWLYKDEKSIRMQKQKENAFEEFFIWLNTEQNNTYEKDAIYLVTVQIDIVIEQTLLNDYAKPLALYDYLNAYNIDKDKSDETRKQRRFVYRNIALYVQQIPLMGGTISRADDIKDINKDIIKNPKFNTSDPF